VFPVTDQDNIQVPEVLPDRDPDGRFAPGNMLSQKLPQLTNPIEVESAILKYFKECEETVIAFGKTKQGDDIQITEPLNMEGLAQALGISRISLQKYRHGKHVTGDEGYNRIVSLIIRARGIIKRSHIARSLTGVYDSKIASLIMQGDMGYSTKSESINLNINKDMTDNELDAKLSRLVGIE
jgi:hypothetical protein